MEYYLFKEGIQDEQGNRIPRGGSYILLPLDNGIGIILKDDENKVSRYVVPFNQEKKKKNVKSKAKNKSQ